MRAERLVLASAIALAACAQKLAPDGPTLGGVSPALGYTKGAVELRITGDRFWLAGVNEGDGGARVSAGHRAWLGGTELAGVRRVNDRTLLATVPAGIPPGAHALEVETPLGKRGRLEAAYVAIADAPPALAAQVVAPPRARLGSTFEVSMEVRNAGEVTATGVSTEAPLASGDGSATLDGPVPAPQDVPGGETRRFSWTLAAARRGDVALTLRAGGTDPYTHEAIEPVEASTIVRITTPPELRATAAVDRPAAAVGETFTLSIEVRNEGDGAVLRLAPSIAQRGTGTAQALDVTSPRDLSGHATTRFDVRYRALSFGDLELDVEVVGSDAEGEGAAVRATARASISIGSPAALTATAAPAPARVSTGQIFTATLLVSNVGDADATVTPTLQPPGSAVQVVAAPSVLLVPGGARDLPFTWVLRGAQQGSAAFAMGVAGAQVGDPTRIVSAAATAGPTVVSPAAALVAVAAVAPARVTVAQTFDVALDVTNAGGTDASVTPSLDPPGPAVAMASEPEPAVVGAGATRRFTWTIRGREPGVASFTMRAAGVDANDPAQTFGVLGVAGPTAVQSAPALSAAGAAPVRVSTSQTFTVTLDVTNSGDAAADVTATLDPPGAAVLVVAAPDPIRAIVPGHGTRPFTWTIRGAAPGTASFTMRVSGTDANDPSRAVGAFATAGPTTVETAASLSGTAAPAPARVSVDQTFTLTLDVENSGQAAASLAPSLDPPGAAVEVLEEPVAATVPGHGTHAFTWRIRGAAPGAASFVLRADGADANDARRRLGVSASAGTTLVQPAALLTAAGAPARPHASVGQAFQVTLLVSNAGQAGAVVSATLDPEPAFTVIVAPAPSTIPGGAVDQPFTWTVRAVEPGSATFRMSVAGVDANDPSRAVSAGGVAGPTTIQSAAALSAAPRPAPLRVSTGQTFTVTLDVTNAGDASADVTATLDAPGAAVVVVAEPDPARALVPGRGTRPFTWTIRGAASGTASFTMRVAGTDANDGAQNVGAFATAGPTTVQTAASLSATARPAPERVSVGQTFLVTLTVTNAGQATASVTPSLDPVGPALEVVSAPQAEPTLVPGQGARELTWILRGANAGSAAITARVAGYDGNDVTREVGASAAAGTPLVQTAASLSASVTPAPARVSVGQAFAVTLTVTNTGHAAAIVTPSLDDPGPALEIVSGPAAEPTSVPGQADAPGTRAFTWTLRAAAAGTAPVACRATGHDANDTTREVGVSATAGATTVQTAASLSATATAAPARVSVEQTFTLTLDVENSGQAAASVTPAIDDPGPAIEILEEPLAATVPGNGSRPFTWRLRGAASGTAAFTLRAEGADANDATRRLSVSASAGSTAVQRAAVLTAEATAARPYASVGQTFEVALLVSNAGEAGAAVSASLDPDAPITVLVAPAPFTLAGGAVDHAVKWRVRAVEPGPATFRMTVAGVDANDPSRTVSAVDVSGPTTVQAAAAVSAEARAAPLRVSTGQTFTVTLDVKNSGDAAADVTATLDPPGPAVVVVQEPDPVRALVPGRGTRPFTWTIRGVAPGTASFTMRAAGTDANDPAQDVGAFATAGPTTVQTAASLSATASPAPSRVSVGQEVALTLTVTNASQASAIVTPAIVLPAALEVVNGPAAEPTTVPGQAQGAGTRTFTWAVRGKGSGEGTVTMRVEGADANDPTQPAGASAVTGPVTVQTRPQLTANVSAPPPTLAVGQRFELTLLVSNAGQADATLDPDLDLSSAPLSVVSRPLAATVPGGARDQRFTWVLEGAAPGPVAPLSPRVTGADRNDPAWPVSATDLTAAFQVQAVARLGAGITATPDPVNRGRTITVVMRVENVGDATVTGARPLALAATAALGASLTGPSPSGGVTLAKGGSATFTWTCAATTAGGIAFTGRAGGADGNTGEPVESATATSDPIVVQDPAEIALEPVSVPARVNVGQRFTAQVAARNRGQAGARDVDVSISVAGAAPVADTAPASAALLGGGESQTFQRAFDAGARGVTSIIARVDGGTDANDGSTLPTTERAWTLAVDRPAALAASLSVPTPLPAAGATFDVAMLVTNTGEAVVTNVRPTAPLQAIGGNASVTETAAPSSGLTLAGGQGSTLVWRYRVDVAGTLQLAGSVQGTDANDLGTRTAYAQSQLATGEEAAVVSSDLFGDGTTVARFAAYAGALYVGPSRDGTEIVRLDPALGLQPERLSVAIRMDPQINSAMRNVYWLGEWLDFGRPATTFGSSLCVQNDKVTCGPDLEDGRGTLFSGTFPDGEWLLMAPATTGGVRYVYATSSTSSPLDFAWMDLRSGAVAAAKGIDSATVVNGRLYLGYVDQSETRPALRVVTKAPVYSGFDALDGSTVLNLGANRMPYVGAGGTPPNAAQYQGIDAVASVGGLLYVANNGGMMRSTVAAPRPYAPGSEADWAVSLPPSGASASAWEGRTSIVLPASIEPLPSDRAVPMVAEFRGRLFVPRNVLNSGSVAAQLWSCTPGTDGACDPQDWALVAPEGDLTKLGIPTNEGITVLVATDSWLYVGFDNRDSGVQLFRTSLATPSLADLKGLGGCAAGTQGCVGIGGAGFGNKANKRFLDAEILRDGSGRQRLFVATGDPATGQPVRIFEIPP